MSAAQRVGFGLLAVGTVVAALGGARLPDVHAPTVGVGFVLLLVGTVAMRRASGASGSATGRAGSADEVLTSLRGISAPLTSLAADAAEAPLPDLVRRLADLQRDVLDPLGERAPGTLGALGGDTFAQVFGPYAAAERAIGRARSAATDGHRAEVVAALAVATRELASAVAATPTR